MLSEGVGREPIDYMLNIRGRYVPEEDSDLVMNRGEYKNRNAVLHRSLPEKADLGNKIKRKLTDDERIEKLGRMYLNRDLSPFYCFLPESRRAERRKVFVEKHFKLPKSHKRIEELRVIREQALSRTEPNELVKLYTEFFKERYKPRQIPKIYNDARAILERKKSWTFEDDHEDFEELNRILKYKEEPVPLPGMEDLLMEDDVSEPEPEPEEEKVVNYMLNSQGRYVPEEESDMRMDVGGCRDFHKYLLRVIKGELYEGAEDRNRLKPDDVLAIIASYYRRALRRCFWDNLPDNNKRRRIDMMCSKLGLDPSKIADDKEFADAFLEKKKDEWIGMTESGKRDFRAVYAVQKRLIKAQEERSERICSQEEVDDMNMHLRFPELEQARLPFGYGYGDDF